MKFRSTAIAIALMIIIMIPLSEAEEHALKDLPSRGNKLIVGPGAGNYSTVQAAVDAASPGDWIDVTPGYYPESVTVNKTLTIAGSATNGPTITGSVFVFKVEADHVHLWGLRIQGSGARSVGVMGRDITGLQVQNCEVHADTGIYLNNASRTQVKWNSINSSAVGVEMYDSDECQIWYNDFHGGSWTIVHDGSDNSISHNICQGRDTGISLEYGSSGNTIRNNTLEGFDTGIGLRDASSSNVVLDNSLEDNTEGIAVLTGSTGNNLEGNMVYGDGEVGILITSGSDDVSLSGNVITGMDIGISIGVWQGDILGVKGAMLLGNKVQDSIYGISANVTEDLWLVNCTMEGNSFAAHLYGSDGLVVKGCSVTNNSLGFIIRTGVGGIIKHTLFEDNDGYALDLGWGAGSAKDHSVHNNSFVGNNGAGLVRNVSHVQAFGGSSVERPQQWDDGIGHGNYWSDWTTPDNDSDGIIDRPYHTDQISIPYSTGDRFPLTVSPLNGTSHNMAPRIVTDNVMTCDEDEFYSVDYDASDQDPLFWYLETDAGFLSLDKRSGVLTGTPKNRDVGNHNITVSVTDGILSDVTSFTLTVVNVNDPPELGSGDPSMTVVYDPVMRRFVLKKIDLFCEEDEVMNLTFIAGDEDKNDDVLYWAKVVGPSFLRTSSQDTKDGGITVSTMYLTGIPRNGDVGKHIVTINVTDESGGSATTTFNLTVNNTNDDPVITTGDLTFGKKNDAYKVDYNATDEDPTSDTLTWSLRTNASFLSIVTTTGVLSGTLGKPGLYWVNVSVADGNGGHDHSNFTLLVADRNGRPLSAGPPPAIGTDEDTSSDPIDLRALFVDPDGDELTFQVIPGPNLSVYVDLDMRMHITPRDDWAGTDQVIVIAFDGRESISMTIPVTVTNVNDPPEITSLEVPSGNKEGVEIVIRASAIDVDLIYGDEIGFIWYLDGSGEVGRGPELRITFDEGTYEFLLRIVDASGSYDERSFTLEVMGASPPVEDGEISIWTIIAVVVVLLIVLSMVAILAFLFRRGRSRNAPDGNSSIQQMRSGSLTRGRLWDALERGSDPALAEVFDELLAGGGGTSTVGPLKDRINTDYGNDMLTAEEYAELMGVLDKIEE